jgi:chemotaxis protein histidine kinase CheA
MIFSDEELEEFRKEIVEYLVDAEAQLNHLQKGGNFQEYFDSLFRLFHNIKGSAVLLSITPLHKHMEEILTLFQKVKYLPKVTPEILAFFVKAIGVSSEMLEGKPVTFDYTLPNAAPPVVTEVEPEPEAPKESFTEITRIMINDE